jgi:hypothetical protein
LRTEILGESAAWPIAPMRNRLGSLNKLKKNSNKLKSN